MEETGRTPDDQIYNFKKNYDMLLRDVMSKIGTTMRKIKIMMRKLMTMKMMLRKLMMMLRGVWRKMHLRDTEVAISKSNAFIVLPQSEKVGSWDPASKSLFGQNQES